MFKTIDEKYESSEIVQKKSKFIADIFYVETATEAEEKIKIIKKKYYDSRHNCFAYRIYSKTGIIQKFSDDGEPSGTAGAPMLNILQKNNLCNILIIVTRYFGGILLGTGGLVRAYSDSLIGAIDIAVKINQTIGIEMEVTLDYNQFEKFQHYCKINTIEIKKVNYLDNIICRISLEEAVKDKLLEDFKNKSLNIIKLEVFGKTFVIKNEIK